MQSSRFFVSFLIKQDRILCLAWRTVQSCPLRYNNTECYVGIGHGSVVSVLMQECRVRYGGGERLCLSCLLRSNNAEFSVGMGNDLISWEYVCVWECESMRVWECESVRVWECGSVSIHHLVFSIVHSAFKNLTFDQSNFWYTFAQSNFWYNFQKSSKIDPKSAPGPPGAPRVRPRAPQDPGLT